MQAAKDYIEKHSAEKFSLKALSDALFINGSYLLRLFRSRTGQTLLGYHNRVRCDRAQALLRDTRMSISEVGEAVGFVSSARLPACSGRPRARRHRMPLRSEPPIKPMEGMPHAE